MASPQYAVAQASPTPSWEEGIADDAFRDWSDEVPAHISIVDGSGWLDRDDLNEAATEGTPLLAGDRLRTSSGRLEVLFADGSVLTLDEHTDAEFLSDTLLRVDRGRIRLELARSAATTGYRIDAVGATAWIRTSGEYRLEVNSTGSAAPTVQLLVIRGLAELTTAEGRTLVRAGYEAWTSAATAPSLPYAVTVSTWDAFDRWWDARRAERTSFSSAQRLPAEISYYSGTLDRYGDWRYEPVHGYVWYPHVDDGWSPYSAGRWSFVGSYGWVWIGAQRWSWPTHHYGRWGVSGHRYYWIPGRHWAPAWVSWASTTGYVGWSPLGFDNRPLVSVTVGYAHGWRGWTYLPSHHFNVRVVASTHRRYAPPLNVHVASHVRGPVRPAGIVARANQGLRGPAYVSRSVAIPRTPARSSASSPTVRSMSPGSSAAPGRRAEQVPPTTPGARPRTAISPYPETSTASAPNRAGSLGARRAGTLPAQEPRESGQGGQRPLLTNVDQPSGARPRVNTPSTQGVAPASRSRGPSSPEGVAPSWRREATAPSTVSPAPTRQPSRAPSRAPSSPGPSAESSESAPPAGGRFASSVRGVPRTPTASLPPNRPSQTPDAPAVSERESAPSPRRQLRTMPSSPSQERPTSAPTTVQRERSSSSAPSRASRVESSRQSERQAPASGGGRATARGRAR